MSEGAADFTFDTYEHLVRSGLRADYDFLPVREYLRRRDEDLPPRFILLRHDVDRKPENALEMARLEAELGVESTYYVRTIDKTLRPQIVEEVADLGHEVGYHYEDLDRADGDREAARRTFASELERLRQYAPVETVCMHGNPLTPHDNRDLWGDDPAPLLAEHDLLGEAYLSMDFEDVTYFSDTGRTWRDGSLKIKDHTRGEGEKPLQVGTTFELVDLIDRGRLDRLCLLTHPNRWARTYPELVVESLKDATINVGKHGLNLVR